MKARWTHLLEKFAALSLRERLMILLAMFVVTYQVADMVVLDRQFQRIGELNRQMASDNVSIFQLNIEQNALSNQVQQDPNKELRAEIETVRQQVAAAQARLHEVTRELMSPQDMARFLEELLVQNDGLTMLRLQTFKAQPVIAADTAQADARARPAALHRHAFGVEFAGGYLETLRYMQALEALPWRFFWDSVSYEVIDYPKSIVRLKLHTLSLSEDWIGV